MTYYREVQFHEIPDAYARQTLAMAEAHYAEPVEEYEDDTPEEVLDPERFVSEHDYWTPTAREVEELQITDDVLAFWTEYHRLPL